jgi:hypothetical protein
LSQRPCAFLFASRAVEKRLHAILPVDFWRVKAMAKKNSPSKSAKRKSTSSSKQKPAQEKNHEPSQGKISAAAPAAPAKSVQPPAKSPGLTVAPKLATRGTIPAEAALSFLRDTKGSVSWSLRDLSHTLSISREEAERAVALLQIQGYVQPEAHKSGEWMTTPSGEIVAGAKTPRFDRETVEAALTSLRQRIEDTNNDRAARFRITRAVAFGDFLAKDRARVQAAEIGIELARRDLKQSSDEIATLHSAAEAREEQGFLRQLRGRSALINLRNYSEWMGTRTHQKLF